MDKLCKKCLKTKDISEFYKHPQMGDGHLSKCKECARADVSENRADNIEHYRQYDRKRYDESGRRSVPSREAQNRSAEKWRKSHKLERRAHRILERAVESGTVCKPSSCSKCGSSSHRIEGHHTDYSKPLDVEWLCKPCHAKTWKKPRGSLSPKKRGGYKGSMLPTRAEQS